MQWKVNMRKENKSKDIELLKRFLDETQAEAMLSEMDAAQQIFEINTAPLPEKAVLDKIKLEMNCAFAEKRKHESRLFFVRITAAAAVMIITAFAGIKYIGWQQNDNPNIVIGSEFWDESALPQDSEIEARIASLERSDAFVTLDTTGQDSATIADLESEIEDFGSFWEG
jgi:cytochrome c-type biogenesis protein CcmH/NrfG